MSTKCERVFNSLKKLLTPERNQLAEDIIEACECLKLGGRRSLFNRTRAAVSSVAARLTASTAVRPLVTGTATLPQQGPSLSIMESEQHHLLLHQVLRQHFLIRRYTLLHTLEGPRLRAP